MSIKAIKQILLVGPSSVGKTTYAIKKYNSNKYCLIDSDQVWYLLGNKYSWDRKKIEEQLYPCMIKLGKACKKIKQIPVFIDNSYKILDHLKRSDTHIIVLSTRLHKLVKNFYKRNDSRLIRNVLRNWETFFITASTKGKNSFLIKKDHLKEFKPNNKQDQVAIKKFIKYYFGNKKETWVKTLNQCDQLVVL